jgi:peptidoglycan/LPS O-acetylase OafA/YrhL
MHRSVFRARSESQVLTSTSASLSTPVRRSLQLDILRGIAILLVLFRHTPVEPERAGVLAPLAQALFHLGWTGVDLFFVLSGYLIGGLLLAEIERTGTLDRRRFWIRRAFKILPPYLAFLAFMWIFFVVRGENHSWSRFWPSLVYLQNYVAIEGDVAGHLWSVAVEEHFYLLLPTLLLLLMREKSNRLRAIPWIASGIAVTLLLYRVIAFSDAPFSDATYIHTHIRLDGLFWGVALAYLMRSEPVAGFCRRRRSLLALAGLLLISPMSMLEIGSEPFVYTVGYTMLYVGYGLILMAIVSTPLDGRAGRVMSSRFGRLVAWIGIASYGIYLVHYDLAERPIGWLIHRGALDGIGDSGRWGVAILLYITLASLSGWLLTRLIERPSLMLRERLFPSR